MTILLASYVLDSFGSARKFFDVGSTFIGIVIVGHCEENKATGGSFIRQSNLSVVIQRLLRSVRQASSTIRLRSPNTPRNEVVRNHYNGSYYCIMPPMKIISFRIIRCVMQAAAFFSA